MYGEGNGGHEALAGPSWQSEVESREIKYTTWDDRVHGVALDRAREQHAALRDAPRGAG